MTPFSLMLFGGDIHVEHLSQFVVIDQRIRFKVSVTSGVYAGDSVFPDAVWWRYSCGTSVTICRHRSAN